MEQAMTICLLQMNTVENYNLVYKGLICAIDVHRKATKLVSIKWINLFY